MIEHRSVDAEGLAGTITASQDTLRADPGSLLLLPVTIHNEGGAEWLAEGITRVVVSYKLFNEDGVCVVEDGLRTMLPNRMGAGDTGEIELRIRALGESARFTVSPLFVRERVAWFGVGPSVALQVGSDLEAGAGPGEISLGP